MTFLIALVVISLMLSLGLMGYAVGDIREHRHLIEFYFRITTERYDGLLGRVRDLEYKANPQIIQRYKGGGKTNGSQGADE